MAFPSEISTFIFLELIRKKDHTSLCKNKCTGCVVGSQQSHLQSFMTIPVKASPFTALGVNLLLEPLESQGQQWTWWTIAVSQYKASLVPNPFPSGCLSFFTKLLKSCFCAIEHIFFMFHNVDVQGILEKEAFKIQLWKLLPLI